MKGGAVRRSIGRAPAKTGDKREQADEQEQVEGTTVAPEAQPDAAGAGVEVRRLGGDLSLRDAAQGAAWGTS